MLKQAESKDTDKNTDNTVLANKDEGYHFSQLA